MSRSALALLALIYAEDETTQLDAPTPDSGLGVVGYLDAEGSHDPELGAPVVFKSDADARIAEMEAMVDRLHKLCEELHDRLTAERGPVVAYRDRDGDVWSPVPYMDEWVSPGMGSRPLNQIVRRWGPLTSLHAGGAEGVQAKEGPS